jgi:hypothetical protein
MIYNSLSNIYVKSILLKEYTESTIQELITKFTPETNDGTNVIRTNIERFEKIKDSERFKKLMPILLPNINVISDLKTYKYKELTTILKWFAGDAQTTQKLVIEPQEAPGVPPQKLPQGDAVGLEIYVAHNYEQARYLAVEHFGRFYSYCVRVRANWNSYRYVNNQTFYFVYDPEKDCLDDNHLLVIRPSPQASYIQPGAPITYNVSNARNADTTWVWDRTLPIEARYNGVKAIVEEQPKLRTLKDVFVPLKHTARELKDIEIGNYGPGDFKQLDYYNKSTYISIGKRIYAEDYALLDKDLQNDYINSQDRWENLSVLKEGKKVTVLGVYGLMYPFAIPNDGEESYGHELTTRKLLGLYVTLRASKTQDFSPLLNIHTVIADGTGPAKKRYMYLLERNREKIFGENLSYVKQLIPEILKLRNDDKAVYVLKGVKLNLLDLLAPKQQKDYIFLKKYIVTVEEFKNIEKEYQKKYIKDWFIRDGGYNDGSSNYSNNINQYRPVTALFADISIEDSNAPINDSATIEEYVDKHPGFKDVSDDVKAVFVSNLKEYSEKEK